MYASSTWLLKFIFFQPAAVAYSRGENEVALWPGVLFVQDVVMAGSIEEEDARVAAFGEDVVIDCSSLSSVHVLHQDGYVQGLG